MNKPIPYTLREIDKKEIAQVAALIANGYQDDIFFKWVVPNANDRLSVVTQYYIQYLSAGGCIAHVAENLLGNIVGATVWLPHDVDSSLYDSISKAAGKYACNFEAVADASHDSEPHEIPFYQLVGFVVDKTCRNSGLGAALLKYQLDILDKRGIATYLEASTPYCGKGVYGKFGYQAYGKLLHFTDSAVLYPLFREAQTPHWLEEFVARNPAPHSIIGDIGTTTPATLVLGEEGIYAKQIAHLNQQELNQFLFNIHSEKGVSWSISGDREYRSALYAHADEEWVSQGLTIHVGVDIIVPKGTPVYAPYSGEISHVLYEDCKGGYGWIIALKVDNFYLLFGHLAKEGLPAVGDTVSPGDVIGMVGDFNENGNWFHHIHFQAMSQEGIDKGFIYEALFAPDDMQRADILSPSVMPIIRAWGKDKK